jgi:hypothetical protein
VSRQRQALHQEQAREGAPEASLKRVDLAAEMVGLHEWAQRVKTLSAEGHRERSALAQAFPKAGRGGKSLLSCSVVARSTKEMPGCLVGHPVISGNLAQGFVVLTDTAHHLRPFFSRDAVLRLTWACMLLYSYERGNTTEHLLEGEESLIKLAVRCKEVN